MRFIGGTFCLPGSSPLTIRKLKAWNKKSGSSLRSFHLECLSLKVLEERSKMRIITGGSSLTITFLPMDSIE